MNSSAPRNPHELLRDTRGLSTVEYVIILVLIAAAAVTSWSLLGQTMQGKVKASIGEMHKVKVSE